MSSETPFRRTFLPHNLYTIHPHFCCPKSKSKAKSKEKELVKLLYYQLFLLMLPCFFIGFWTTEEQPNNVEIVGYAGTTGWGV